MTEPSECPLLDKFLDARPLRRAAERLYGKDVAEALDECAEISRKFAATRAACGIPDPPASPAPMLRRLPCPDQRPFDREAFTRMINKPLRVTIKGAPGD